MWVATAVAEAAHREQLAEHDGGEGTRDAGAHESAMAQARQRAVYEDCDACDLAAAYAFGIARNHPFDDSKKRMAAVVGETFLALNRWQLTASDAELVVAFVALAAGELSEADLTQWFRDHAAPVI